MHDLITRLDAVAEARLVIRDGGTLDVNVTERVPAILWRHQTGIEMLDARGTVSRRCWIVVHGPICR